MGGPWRDRNYVPSVPTGHRPTSGETVIGPTQSLLGAYLAGIIIGAILGTLGLILASPWLPFGVLR